MERFFPFSEIMETCLPMECHFIFDRYLRLTLVNYGRDINDLDDDSVKLFANKASK